MKIISSYVDSYDYLVRTKYGCDNNVVYDRRFIYGQRLMHKDNVVFYKDDFTKLVKSCYHLPYIKGEEEKYFFISIVGEVFFCEKASNAIVNQEDLKSSLLGKGEHFTNIGPSKNQKQVFVQGFFSNDMLKKVHIVTGVPVFAYEKYDCYSEKYRNEYAEEIVIDNKIPKIGKIKGIFDFIANDSIYVKIYKFLSDLKAERPVKELDDLIKLQKKGFDKRFSFRHQKKE